MVRYERFLKTLLKDVERIDRSYLAYYKLSFFAAEI
jgi:hypothetical protein